MTSFSMDSLVFAVGIIGTATSLLVFASPIKTFYGVVKRKSTEKQEGAPYIATLLCTSLWSFYGLLKPGGCLIAAVNGVGAIFHFFYILLFLIYSPHHKKVKTALLVGILDVVFLGAVVTVINFAFHGTIQLTVLGMLCSALTILMYASPLLALKTVIKTKSVECMPLLLSFFMFLNAGIWAFYSLLLKDFYIGIPNFIGLVLGSAQLTVYMIYKERKESSNRIAVTMGQGKGNMLSAMEMGEYGIKDCKANYNTEAVNVMEKALKRVKSLPKPTLNHEKAFQRALKKAFSLESILDWAQTDDYSITS